MRKGCLLVVVMLVVIGMIVYHYDRYTDLNLSGNDIKQFQRFNDVLLTNRNTSVNADSLSVTDDEQLRDQFNRLRSEHNILSIGKAGDGMIYYKIKHEKVTPVYGPGLKYFSHYLFYSEKHEVDFELLFRQSYWEEKLVKTDRLNGNWYYVIGEHFSD